MNAIILRSYAEPQRKYPVISAGLIRLEQYRFKL